MRRGLSCRRACALLGVARSALPYQPRRAQRDGPLLIVMRELARKRRRYGYRRITAVLRRSGQLINHKRIYRLWRLAGLQVRRRRRKRRSPTEAAPMLQAGAPRQVWAYDFVFDHAPTGSSSKC
ncbi:MAG: hypothetical protein KatS3mg057_0930 [Herpetosiphonaceae bacterium]|nr:MAG: hypothetical protein KatS3mg057_0930 [Herpetosiphonaceae bacterium]